MEDCIVLLKVNGCISLFHGFITLYSLLIDYLKGGGHFSPPPPHLPQYIGMHSVCEILSLSRNWTVLFASDL